MISEYCSGMDVMEVASRIKFEAKNVIRFLTPDNRDILLDIRTAMKSKGNQERFGSCNACLRFCF